MGERMLVVVYGRALNMAGIAASLREEAGLEVANLDPHNPAARLRLVEMNPDAVAFDLSDPRACLDVTLLRDCPATLFIGLDPSSDELLVLARESAAALHIADLLGVIHKKFPSEKAFPEEAGRAKPSIIPQGDSHEKDPISTY